MARLNWKTVAWFCVIGLLLAGVSPAAGPGKVKHLKLLNLPLKADQNEIIGRLPRTAGKIRVEIDGTETEFLDQEITGRRFRGILADKLIDGQRIRVIAYVGTNRIASSLLAVVGEEYKDTRDNFQASGYLGISVDTFASGDTKKYLNPEASGGIKERGVAGFDFAYRVFGNGAPVSPRHGQLWVYGETVHGMRSSEVDCEENANFPTCENAVPNQGEILYIIRNSSSLEAFMGLRWEFHTFQLGSESPANLYLNGQAGFVTVADGPDDVSDLHHIGLGTIATGGTFEGSYLEAGFGRNDLMAEKSKDRWMIDAYLRHPFEDKGGMAFFVQINVDADIGSGSDSIQTYFGFEFDLRRKPFKGGGNQ